MKEELDKEQAKKDLLFLALKLAKAHKEINEAYLKIKEIFEDID